MSYQTYIFGRDAAVFNPEVLNAFEKFGAEVRRQPYLARWRVLHIDGFEIGCRQLTPRGARKLHFTVTAAPPTTTYHRYVDEVSKRTPGAPAALSAPYGSEQKRSATAITGTPNWLEDQKS